MQGGLAVDEQQAFNLLTKLLPISMNMTDQYARMKLLAGPNSYAIYKMIEARNG